MSQNWVAVAFAAAAVYCGSAYATLLWLGSKPESSPCSGCSRCTRDIYKDLADDYDTKVGWDEMLMLLNWIRWGAVREAAGKVLEVSAGTGRNLALYSDEVESLVVTDVSYSMLRRAQHKWEDMVQSRPFDARFVLADAERLVRPASDSRRDSAAAAAPQPCAADDKHETWWSRLCASVSGSTAGAAPSATAEPAADVADGTSADAPPPPSSEAAASETAEGDEFDGLHLDPLAPLHAFEPGSFDTVVDTFGLCSCEDPVAALRQLSQVVKADGTIILLEHGRSTWGFINDSLDGSAARHFSQWGCWWNRDMLDIVRQAGLRVESSSRWHFGTTYVIKARPCLGEPVLEAAQTKADSVLPQEAVK